MDLYKSGNITTKIIQTLVLDEADKIMDMGFMPQILPSHFDESQLAKLIDDQNMKADRTF